MLFSFLWIFLSGFILCFTNSIWAKIFKVKHSTKDCCHIQGNIYEYLHLYQESVHERKK